MSASADIADRDEQMLARLAELDLAAAERVHARLMAAEAADEVADLGRTYQRLARSLRQTLALKAKLKREREQAPRDDSPPRKPGGAAVARRIRELREGVLRVIWDEAEDSETADWHEEALEETIREEMLKDSFGVEPLDDHVARVCLALGFAPERIERWRELPDPPPPAHRPDPEPGWQSSA